MALRSIIFVIYVLLSLSTGKAQHRKRRQLQDIKTEIDDIIATSSNELEGIHTNEGTTEARVVGRSEISREISAPEKDMGPNLGVKCPVIADKVKFAVESFWSNDFLNAFSCSAELMEKRESVDLAHSILLAISAMKHRLGETDSQLLKLIALNKHALNPMESDAPVTLTRWEVLSPIAVGKLEVDADPSFDSMNPAGEERADFDVGQHLLGMKRDRLIFSELMPSGVVSWREILSKTNGAVEVHSPVQWNELAQGVSTASAYEFQGWARVTTFVKFNGLYVLNCQGVHTVYVRNGNQTRLHVGDVYHSGRIRSLLDLSAGPVGILTPLRGVAVTSFSCSFSTVTDPIQIMEIKHVPDLLELHPYVEGKGLLLCGVFSMSVQNLENQEFSLNFRVEPPRGVSNTFSLLKANRESKQVYGLSESMSKADILIAPGQTMTVPLEIVSFDEKVYIPCRKSLKFIISVIPSRGNPVKKSIEFLCRRQNESFLVSFVDHDSSISQAAVVLPLKTFPDDIFLTNNGNPTLKFSTLPAAGQLYPLILSLHGTGISAKNQADAFKVMPERVKDYIFGVKDYWVIAPSRHGAHNWEAIGDLSARSSIAAVQRMMFKFPTLLPQVSLVGLVISGHSMGGHGAWVLSSNLPESAVCVSSAAGWTRKEDYGNSNDFFKLDVSNSYIDLPLKMLLEKSMSEFHVDKFVSNLQFLDVHIRVGSNDLTTHPYYSRRMYRLLKLHNINVTLEEVPGKQHWWWDTGRENDGGVLNDFNMRDFFSFCSIKSKSEINRLTSGTVTADRCTFPFTLSLINTANQNGLCGVRIIQQFKIMSMSTILMSCKGAPNIDKICHVYTNGNVKRAYLADITKGSVALIVDGLTITGSTVNVDGTFVERISPETMSLNICWNNNNLSEATITPSICTQYVDPMVEKLPDTNGPFRQLYSKPFMIVYGTPQGKEMRLAMKDFAIYLANSHLSSHETHVQVMSDQDYVFKKYSEFDDLYNVLFIGGPSLNRAMRKLCSFKEENDTKKRFHCKSPVYFQVKDSEKQLFTIGPHTFDKSDDAVLFTMPVTKSPGHDARTRDVLEKATLGACIHANTANGFLHMSRLAWPVVPPMVRAPFANYIPDYMVINSNVWQQGMAAVQLAGFWDSYWKFDREQAFA